MTDWLGIDHLFELFGTEAVWGFFTPLIIFAVFFVAQLILPVSFALVFGHFGNLWAWTYSVFVVSFFTVRQRFDEKACAQKYRPEKWAEYQTRVPYRMFPGIY